ncbi:MBL fold metallo-hydrolase [Jeotgalibacillus campisalis]|uniref:Beta-lactamase n=1 Tax=Jeotgalibacillus campisalis TaxID=220754 RepID=A0A0C2VPG1_9BACL|nr:MBL fold metallo-hydrolase [Jeotgalibacillus campisalis]KIL45898.1 beta-lactamase [Jeotgalibacillus campisalis]
MTVWYRDIAQLTIPTPFAVGDVHVYVIKGERMTLVDTGPKTNEAWEALESQLSAIGLVPERIDQVVLTHHHPDHAGLIERFPHAAVIGSKEGERFLVRDDEFIKDHDVFYKTFFSSMGLPESYFVLIEKMKEPLQALGNRGIDQAVSEGDILQGASKWKVIETPGHSQGHISLFRENDGLLIGGDMLLSNVSSNPLIEPPFSSGEPRPLPQLQYNESLKRLQDMPLSAVLPGHGPVVSDPSNLLSHRLKKQHERAMYVKQLIAQKESTAFEICMQLFPSVYRKQLGLTLSETMGQIDYLVSLGEIEIVDRRGDAFLYGALTNIKEPVNEQEIGR